MKPIRSIDKALKKLKTCSLLTDGRIFYMNDFHKTKVYKNIAAKLIDERYVKSVSGIGYWFERAYSLYKPIDKQKGIEIYGDTINGKYTFFFRLKGKLYYEATIEKLWVRIGYETSKNKNPPAVLILGS
ncbi:MAG: hypothetical protein LC105_06055 [Chitinophagales bacterium]|nr:hypothetical protein [Chitinophagales bacterium]